MNPAPVLNVSTTSLTLPATIEGTAGATTSFTVSGSNLGSGDSVFLDAPTGCEISINSSSNFAGSLAFNLGSGGSLANTTIYARISASATASVNGSLSVDDANYASLDKSITVSGTVNPAPVLSVSTTSLTLPSTIEGTAGATTSFTVSGSNLGSGDSVFLDAPTGSEISTSSSSGFGLTLTLSDASGTLATTTVYARISASAPAGSFSGILYVDDANYPSLDIPILVIGTVNQPAVSDLTLSVGHNGNFKQGDTADAYYVAVSNVGSASTTGTVTVTDTLPSGLTPTVADTGASNGWTLSTNGQTVTGTCSDVLPAGDYYPTLTVTVAVAANAPASLTNTATVSGGGETNTTNDSASDPTTIIATPVLSVSTTSLTLPSTTEGTAGATTSFTVSGSNLGSGDSVFLDAPTGCEISTSSSSGFGLTLTLPDASGTLATTTVYARISASATTSFSGTLYVDDNNYVSVNTSILVSGTVTPPPTVTVSSPYDGQAFTTASITVSGAATDVGGSGLEDVVVLNQTNSSWGYQLLSGNSASYSVSGIALVQGSNVIAVEAYDNADNSSTPVTLTVTYNPVVTPTVTWASPSSIVYGTALGAAQLDATASVPGTFVYIPAAGAVLGAGSQTLSVTFTPTDATDYTTATQTATLVVDPATPTITWPQPSDIVYGTALSATQLDATSSWTVGTTLGPVAGRSPTVRRGDVAQRRQQPDALRDVHPRGSNRLHHRDRQRADQCSAGDADGDGRQSGFYYLRHGLGQWPTQRHGPVDSERQRGQRSGHV